MSPSLKEGTGRVQSLPLSYFQRVERGFTLHLWFTGGSFFVAKVSRGPPESSGRAQPGRAEQSQLSTEPAPRCPSLCCLRARGIRALTTSSNRFSRAFAPNPSSLTPPKTTTTTKNTFSALSPSFILQNHPLPPFPPALALFV